MHWTYKIASILAVALITLAAGFYAQNNEETYPSGPSYDIGISDAHGQPLSTLTGLAATHHVGLARVSYEPDGHGTNRRVISIFGALDGNGMHANSPYPDYGFGPRTRVQRGDRFTDPLGRWLLYGSPRDTASVAKSIRRQGFELNRATPHRHHTNHQTILLQFHRPSHIRRTCCSICVRRAFRVDSFTRLRDTSLAWHENNRHYYEAIPAACVLFHHLRLHRMDDLDFHWCDLLAFRFSLRIRRSGIPLHHHRHNVHGIGYLVIVDCSSKGSGAERTQINPRKAPFTFSHGFRLHHGNHRSRSQLCQFERYELQMAAIPNTENNIGASIVIQRRIPIATVV